MNEEKKKEIETCLDGIDIAMETMRGALKDIDSFKAQIHDILNNETGDELFEFRPDVDTRSLSESPR